MIFPVQFKKIGKRNSCIAINDEINYLFICNPPLLIDFINKNNYISNQQRIPQSSNQQNPLSKSISHTNSKFLI